MKHGLNAKCSNMVKEMVTNCAVAFDGNPKRQVLIMDEVDGMSGGDRGGVADLIQSIKVRNARFICAPGPLTHPLPVIQDPHHLYLQRRLGPEAPLAQEPLPRAGLRETDEAADPGTDDSRRPGGGTHGESPRLDAFCSRSLTQLTQVSENAMEALIENCHSDIRLILNTLQARCSATVLPEPRSLSFNRCAG